MANYHQGFVGLFETKRHKAEYDNIDQKNHPDNWFQRPAQVNIIDFQIHS